MKYVLKILNFLLACFILASCVLEADETITDESTTSASGSSFSANTYIFINLSDIQASEDDSAYYSLSSTETYFLSGNVGITYSNNLIKVDATGIEANLWVYLEGTMTTGGVKIQTSEDYEIGLFLNAVTMTSSNYPCIDCTKGGAVTVCLYGSNVLTDGRQYGYGYGEEYTSTSANPVSVGSDSKGTLYCKGGLSIYESASGGSLTVYQAYKNCIASKAGILYIESGTFTLRNYTTDSSNPGKNGLFGGSGIEVAGGTINFTGNGVISTSDVRKANGFKTDDEDYPNSYVKISGGTTTVNTYNGKGIAAPIIYLAGGTNTFTVDGVTGFTSDNNKSGTYYDADGVKNSNVSITYAPEGIEGDTSVSVSGGTNIISATDDGINAGSSIAISGGFVYVKATGDGIDSNGTITVSGGVTVVATYANDNCPLDFDDSFTVTGGKILAIGTDSMGETTNVTSSINLVNYSSCSGSASTYFAINDSSGNNVVAFYAPYSYSMAMYIDSSLSGTYTAYKNATVSGTEYVSGTGFYLPASSASGTSISSKTASTSASSSGSSGGSSGGPGGSSPF